MKSLRILIGCGLMLGPMWCGAYLIHTSPNSDWMVIPVIFTSIAFLFLGAMVVTAALDD